MAPDSFRDDLEYVPFLQGCFSSPQSSSWALLVQDLCWGMNLSECEHVSLSALWEGMTAPGHSLLAS